MKTRREQYKYRESTTAEWRNHEIPKNNIFGNYNRKCGRQYTKLLNVTDDDEVSLVQIGQESWCVPKDRV